MKKKKAVHPQVHTNEENYYRFRSRLLISFSALLVLLTIFLTTFLFGLFDNIIQNKAAALISADGHQLELNINSYLDRVEHTATMLFSDEKYYEYDCTDDSLDAYEKLQSEEIINSRINDLSMLDNFSDFGIIYANDHVAGWISNTSRQMFPEGGMYDAFAEGIVNSRKEDGWFFGVQGNTDRLYYAKRVNEHAVLVISFYNRELESVFDFPEELQGMTIRLADSENRVLFSTEQEEIGAAVPEEIAASLGDNGTRSTLTHKNLITTDFCSNGWKVICTIPLKIIMKDRDSAVFYTIVFSLISVGIFLLISFLLFRMISKSLNVLFDKLSEKAELDRLSGLLNKIAYEEQVTELLNQRADDEHALMVVLDVDRFKPINDNLGHARGDEVIAGLGRMLDASFSERYLIGRIGGDEFSVFTLYTAENRVDMRQGVDRILAELRQKFITEFKKENESFGTSMSAGVVLMEEEKDTFDKLYKKADRALYTSKENGKGRTSWYGEVNR